MRSTNLIVVTLGGVALVIAAAIAWRWRRLPLVAAGRPRVETPGIAALEGIRTLAVTMSAGVLAGVLVPGLGGRLVMRILGATSGDAVQGATTDANEIVGEITSSGTIAVVFFVGIFGGVMAALAFVVLRRWLPTNAGLAGVVTGILLLGTLGVSDALSPDNEDFAILRPTWLAITLVIALALLFGVTYTALAARLDAGVPILERKGSAVASHAALVIFLNPILLGFALVYVTVQAVTKGRPDPRPFNPRVQYVGSIVIGIGTVLAAGSTLLAIRDITSA